MGPLGLRGAVPTSPFPTWRYSQGYPILGGTRAVPSLLVPHQPFPGRVPSLRWCCPFQRGHFVTMKVLYTCGYSTSLAALLLAISIFSCFR